MQKLESVSRLVLNTVVTYARSLFALIVGLFTSRWVLNALGASDYGLYALAGSVVMLSMFVNTALSIAVTRFYAYTLGESKKRGIDAELALKEWFNTALSLHMMVALIVICIGWPLGEWWVLPRLNIPEARRYAVDWVFRLSVLTSVVTVVAVPYVAMLNAHQLIAEMAVAQMAGNALLLLGAWSLRHVTGDRLLYYAAYMGLVSSGILVALIRFAGTRFPFVCRPSLRLFFNRSRIRELMAYLGWKLFGTACVFTRTQGLPIVVNLHFGSLLNAALSISQTLGNHAQALSQAMVQAMQPALTAIYAAENRDLMLRRVMQSCRLGAGLMLLFVIPVWMALPDLLRLWLRQPPPFTAELCRWALAALLAEKITNGHMIAVNAHGRIREYEFVQGGFYLLAVPLTWIGFRWWRREVAVGEAIFISTLMYCLGRVVFARWLVRIPVRSWITRVVLPLIAGSLPGIMITMVFQRWYTGPAIWRIALQIFLGGLAAVGGLWFFVTDGHERAQIRKWLARWSSLAAIREGLTETHIRR